MGAVVGDLLAKGLLVAEGAHLVATDDGRELIAAVAAATAPVTARIRGGIPAEEPAATGLSSRWSPSAPTPNSPP